MMGAIAVLDSGASSIRFQLYRGEARPALTGMAESIHSDPRLKAIDASGEKLVEGGWPAPREAGHGEALDRIVTFLRDQLGGAVLQAVGHRITHGGLEYAGPVRVTGQVLARLDACVPLAPLHQPGNLLPLRRLLDRAPSVPQVACFDTAFHRAQPELAQMFALPHEMHQAGVRRFGFHGLACESIAARLPGVDPAAARGRTVVLHLEDDASMCAMLECRSIAATMGFTVLDGLPTGTRCGALDAGVVLYLMRTRGLDANAVENLLYRHSGLLGVSGISSDMRTLLASREPRAQLAIDLFAYRIRRELGSLAAALGGLDAIVFTGAIGENAAAIRARVCRDAAWLGVELDAAANDAAATLISASGSRVRAYRIPSDEEGLIAAQTRALTERLPATQHA